MGLSQATAYQTKQEVVPEAPPDEAKSGSSDAGALSIWTEDRFTQLTGLVGGTFTNESSYNIPAGLVDTNDYQYGMGDGAEASLGVSATATAVSPSGSPLTGTATISAGGVTFAQSTVNGAFILSAAPPAGVYTGQNLENDEYNFTFSPSINGVAVSEENMPYTYDAGTIQYGAVSGQILDYKGDPVPNVAVGGKGAADISDKDGRYKLTLPGGLSTTLKTLYGSYSFDVSASGGVEATENITFPQLTIKVIDADLEPVANAPVTIDGKTRYTEENGKVEVPTAEVKDYSVRVMEAFESDAVTVGSAGEEWVYTVGPGATFGDASDLSLGGVKIQAVDADTGRPVYETKAVDRVSGVTSLSNTEGVCKLLSENVGEAVDVAIGTGDKRYEKQNIKGTLPDGSMLEVEVPLRPKTQVVNK
ncbi:VP17 [Haloarcula hispanica icosahedral virus 2]|uniref:VP17 n=1 Tax=Haloarcula hispanica icosahedral virus 2 TaxID=1154689 RepID=H9AZY1_9VIRU|nr:VP17 [Haloarcula hispanica icosahedral virus 2]AFD02306.1 VP17 [Haloarcula hispanica icosahedral virus 2]